MVPVHLLLLLGCHCLMPDAESFHALPSCLMQRQPATALCSGAAPTGLAGYLCGVPAGEAACPRAPAGPFVRQYPQRRARYSGSRQCRPLFQAQSPRPGCKHHRVPSPTSYSEKTASSAVSPRLGCIVACAGMQQWRGGQHSVHQISSHAPPMRPQCAPAYLACTFHTKGVHTG